MTWETKCDVMYYSFIALQTLDILTTLYGLSKGLSENNPLIPSPEIFLALKILSVVMFFFLYKSDLTYYSVLLFLNGALTAIILNNIILIMRVM